MLHPHITPLTGYLTINGVLCCLHDESLRRVVRRVGLLDVSQLGNKPDKPTVLFFHQISSQAYYIIHIPRGPERLVSFSEKPSPQW